MAPHGVQVEGGPPPLPPPAEEVVEEGMHLGLIGVDEYVVVGDHGGGEAAPTRPILVAELRKPASAGSIFDGWGTF